MESTAYSNSPPDEGGARRSAGSNVSTADRDGGQNSVTTRHSSSQQDDAPSESIAPRLAGPCDPGTAAAAAGGTRLEAKTSLGGLSKSPTTPAGGRLPRGVSFLCDESSQGKLASRAGETFSRRYPSGGGSHSGADSSAGYPGGRLPETRRVEPGAAGARRTLSGILRTQPSAALGALSPRKEERRSAPPLARGEVRSHFPIKPYASLTPEMIDGLEASSGKRRAEGERRRRSLPVTDPAAGVSSRPSAAGVAGRSAYSNWAGGGGRGTGPSNGDGGGGLRGSSPLCASESRGRARIRGQSAHRGAADSSGIALPAGAAGGAKRGTRLGGGIEETSDSAGLLYRRSRAWPGPPRQLGAGTKTVGGRRTTFRTCSDSHLGPQQQQYPRSRRLYQDSGTGGGVGVAGSGSAGGGDRSTSGANFSYYSRSRSTQQYVGRSAGLLWASRYSWLPVFSGPTYCGAEEWLEHDQRMRGFWKQRIITGPSHAAATSVAKHVHVGVTFGMYPLCSARRLMWLCLLCSVYFLAMGLWLIVEDENYLECKLNYEAKGQQNGGSRYLLERIRPDMCGSRAGEVTHLPGPVIYVYVEMEHVYQNDAQILWSRSWRQLAGEVITDPAELKECEPFITAEVENRTKVLHPCGALAWNVLTDQYHFLEGPEDDDDQFAHTPIHLNQSQAVVLQAYKGWERLYKNPSKAERAKYRDRVYFWMSPEDNDRRLNPNLAKEHARAELTADRLEYQEAGAMLENAHFIQWMTAGAFGRWRKLYGRLTGPLKLPIYAYISSVYDISPWGGKKAIVLVQHSQFGGRTLFLGIMYVVLGCVLVLLSIWLGWKSWYSRVESDAAADLRWQSRKRSMKKSK